MPWVDINQQHNRDHLRCSTDLTDREWAVLAPQIPPAKSGGRPSKTDMREVVNAILYIAGSGCQCVRPVKPFFKFAPRFVGVRPVKPFFKFAPRFVSVRPVKPVFMVATRSVTLLLQRNTKA